MPHYFFIQNQNVTIQYLLSILGRLHPLLVHLPIGILVLAFLLEIFSRKKQFAYLQPAIPFTLLIGAISAIFAATTGWIMPKNGAFEEELLNLHFWSGIALTVGICLLYLLSRPSNSTLSAKLYFPLFALNMILLTVTGHLGGSLTHGSNYLWETNTQEAIIIEGKIEDIHVFEQVIQPIFKKKCIACHNSEKRKSELLMTSKEGILEGGKTGALFTSNDAANSLIIKRIELPKMEKEHMPPKGKVQISNEELQLLKWWIDAGGDFEAKVGTMNPSEKILAILAQYQPVKLQATTADLPPISAPQLTAIRAKGIRLNPQDAQNRLFEATLAHDTTISQKTLKTLAQIAPHIVKLNLSFSNLDDNLAKQIATFSHLQKLEIQHTDITTSSLQYLKNLNYLKSLNLYATEITDEALTHLQELPKLQNLYLWQTNTSQAAIQNLQSRNPQLTVHHRIDSTLFSKAQLKAPIFVTEQDLFKDSLEVEIKRNFKGVQIYYTLDGTNPDTTSSSYQKPFAIHQSTKIKAIAHKKNWLPSNVSERVYSQTKYEIVEVQLSKAPKNPYQAKGGKSLVDFVKGSLQFKDGNWLGYEGENMTARLDLGAKKSLSGVSIGALEDVGSYIFYPKGIEILASQDGQTFENVANLSIPTATESHPPELKQFLLSFEEIEARYLQVKIKSNLKNPDWHPAPGAKCWIFVDEIIVN